MAHRRARVGSNPTVYGARAKKKTIEKCNISSYATKQTRYQRNTQRNATQHAKRCVTALSWVRRMVSSELIEKWLHKFWLKWVLLRWKTGSADCGFFFPGQYSTKDTHVQRPMRSRKRYFGSESEHSAPKSATVREGKFCTERKKIGDDFRHVNFIIITPSNFGDRQREKESRWFRETWCFGRQFGT